MFNALHMKSFMILQVWVSVGGMERKKQLFFLLPFFVRVHKSTFLMRSKKSSFLSQEWMNEWIIIEKRIKMKMKIKFILIFTAQMKRRGGDVEVCFLFSVYVYVRVYVVYNCFWEFRFSTRVKIHKCFFMFMQ
jgi:hypothetical protein